MPSVQSPGDTFVAALARYVEALNRGYPGGPEEMRERRLDARSNMPRMRIVQRDPAT